MSDAFQINEKSNLIYSGKLEYVTSKVFSDFGIKQLEVIGKDGTIPSTYILGNGDVSYTHSVSEKWKVFGQLGYAERQPTVSEGFGYYLFNSMDGYDYIGIPDLLKERAVKASVGASFTKNKTTIDTKVFHYQFQDYIIGNIDTTYDGMTIGSNGVKIYENIPDASISGFEVNITTRILKHFSVQNTTQFSYGIDNEGTPLQMIPPFQNTTKVGFTYKSVEFRVESIIAAMQNNPRQNAGETTTPSYAILNLHTQMPFKMLKQSWTVSARVNNVFDSNYWDHLDWNSIPRPGRSFILNLKMSF